MSNSISDDVWILGITMTKFGKHPDKDTVDLASCADLEQASGLADPTAQARYLAGIGAALRTGEAVAP